MSVPGFQGDAAHRNLAPRDRAVRAFRERYGQAPAVTVAARGRVNLMGGHVDYHDGIVLPVAIQLGVWVAAGLSDAAWSEVTSLDVDAETPVRLRGPGPGSTQRLGWAAYPAGVAWALRQTTDIPPIRAIYASDLPAEAGLASSAALEVATAAAWLRLSGNNVAGSAPMDLARLCHRAEVEFVGVPCGLMDQAAAVLGRRGHALRLDCRTLAYTHVPLPPSTSLLVFDTGVPRQLRGGQLRQRRLEGQRALELLRAAGLKLDALRDLPPQALETLPTLPAPLFRRVRHVVTEIARVRQATDALNAGDLSEFGELMVASHRSSAEDYESTIDELDHLVAVAAEVPGCYGARVTGAGFGGAVVALVEADRAADVIAEVTGAYGGRFGQPPAVTPCVSADGLVFG